MHLKQLKLGDVSRFNASSIVLTGALSKTWKEDDSSRSVLSVLTFEF
jgi:hypothetical protein